MNFTVAVVRPCRLDYTIEKFASTFPDISVIVVLAKQLNDDWKSLCTKHNFTIQHQLIDGGETRYHSVKNGLGAITEKCIIAIHDGVRPFCSMALIKRCFEEAEKKSNAIPSISIFETIRKVEGEKNFSVTRDNFRIIQTPQCFDSVLLIKAYQNSGAENFTDDATVFESDGNRINLVDGEKNNIKITVQEDLIIASAFNKKLFN